MRLRNIKNSYEIIQNSSYVVPVPSDYKGKWQKLFGNKNSIHLEIGIGKGAFIIGMAKLYSDINFIGIEKFDSVMARAVQKIDQEEIDNVKLIKIDAGNIDDIFKKEIDLIYLNFSDPWPKKKHTNRRLSSMLFLEKYDLIFKDKKIIHLKTDNKNLFDYSLKSLENYGYDLQNITLDLHNSDLKNNVKTEYEEKFSNKGFNICRVEAYKE